jgi:hypothetical protein
VVSQEEEKEEPRLKKKRTKKRMKKKREKERRRKKVSPIQTRHVVRTKRVASPSHMRAREIELDFDSCDWGKLEFMFRHENCTGSRGRSRHEMQEEGGDKNTRAKLDE